MVHPMASSFGSRQLFAAIRAAALPTVTLLPLRVTDSSVEPMLIKRTL